MIQRTPPPRSQRFGVLTAVIAFHLALLLLVLASRGAAPAPAVKAGVMSLLSIEADAPAARPPPKLPGKLVDEIKRLTEQSTVFDPDSTSLAAPSGGCATLDVVSKAIVGDPAAVTAVLHAPPETRSIAEAIVMWNAGWSTAASAPDAPLGPARTIIEESLHSVEDGCLDEAIAGPRLIPVPDGERTMFVVLGSGAWTWRQLISEAEPAPALMPDADDPRHWYDVDWF